MDPQKRAADLIASPKARWALAWLAAVPSDDPRPADFLDAATTPPRSTRLRALRHNPEGLVAELHTRIGDWRYERSARTTVDTLGPADGYQRIATALAKAPASQWWWQPMPHDNQVWICDKPIRRGRGLPFATSYAHHWAATAPVTALTTSTRLSRLPAMALLSDQNHHPPLRANPTTLSAWKVPIKPEARIAEIHSPIDWITLVQKYPSHRTDRCLAPHLDEAWPDKSLTWTVDWHRLSHDYDAVHLSVAGWLTATSHLLSMPDNRGHTFCEGWPTEATIWFRPVFSGEFERLGPDELPHRLEYGYGRPAAGSSHDLRTPPLPTSWWRRLIGR